MTQEINNNPSEWLKQLVEDWNTSNFEVAKMIKGLDSLKDLFPYWASHRKNWEYHKAQLSRFGYLSIIEKEIYRETFNFFWKRVTEMGESPKCSIEMISLLDYLDFLKYPYSTSIHFGHFDLNEHEKIFKGSDEYLQLLDNQILTDDSAIKSEWESLDMSLDLTVKAKFPREHKSLVKLEDKYIDGTEKHPEQIHQYNNCSFMKRFNYSSPDCKDGKPPPFIPSLDTSELKKTSNPILPTMVTKYPNLLKTNPNCTRSSIRVYSRTKKVERRSQNSTVETSIEEPFESNIPTSQFFEPTVSNIRSDKMAGFPKPYYTTSIKVVDSQNSNWHMIEEYKPSKYINPLNTSNSYLTSLPLETFSNSSEPFSKSSTPLSRSSSGVSSISISNTMGVMPISSLADEIINKNFITSTTIINERSLPPQFQSGIKGVVWNRHRQVWEATWKSSNGRRIWVSFRADKYGFEEAKKLAIEHRILHSTDPVDKELCTQILHTREFTSNEMREKKVKPRDVKHKNYNILGQLNKDISLIDHVETGSNENLNNDTTKLELNDKLQCEKQYFSQQRQILFDSINIEKDYHDETASNFNKSITTQEKKVASLDQVKFESRSTLDCYNLNYDNLSLDLIQGTANPFERVGESENFRTKPNKKKERLENKGPLNMKPRNDSSHKDSTKNFPIQMNADEMNCTKKRMLGGQVSLFSSIGYSLYKIDQSCSPNAALSIKKPSSAKLRPRYFTKKEEQGAHKNTFLNSVAFQKSHNLQPICNLAESKIEKQFIISPCSSINLNRVKSFSNLMKNSKVTQSDSYGEQSKARNPQSEHFNCRLNKLKKKNNSRSPLSLYKNSECMGPAPSISFSLLENDALSSSTQIPIIASQNLDKDLKSLKQSSKREYQDDKFSSVSISTINQTGVIENYLSESSSHKLVNSSLCELEVSNSSHEEALNCKEKAEVTEELNYKNEVQGSIKSPCCGSFPIKVEKNSVDFHTCHSILSQKFPHKFATQQQLEEASKACRSNTGILGVCRDTSGRWYTAHRTVNGKRRFYRFLVSEFGEEGAMKKAIEKRKRMEKGFFHLQSHKKRELPEMTSELAQIERFYDYNSDSTSDGDDFHQIQ